MQITAVKPTKSLPHVGRPVPPPVTTSLVEYKSVLPSVWRVVSVNMDAFATRLENVSFLWNVQWFAEPTKSLKHVDHPVLSLVRTRIIHSMVVPRKTTLRFGAQ